MNETNTGLTFFIDELEKSDMKDCIGMMKVLLLGKSAMEGDEGDEIAKSMMQLAKVGLCAVTNKASIIPLLRNAGTYRDDTVLESSDY